MQNYNKSVQQIKEISEFYATCFVINISLKPNRTQASYFNHISGVQFVFVLLVFFALHALVWLGIRNFDFIQFLE